MAIETSALRYGLPSETIDRINLIFATFPAIERALLYGSRAKSTFKPGSDIDLSLVGASLNLARLLEIELALDDLLLPYKIDLSLYHLIDSRALLDHIDRIGQQFYQRASAATPA